MRCIKRGRGEATLVPGRCEEQVSVALLGRAHPPASPGLGEGRLGAPGCGRCGGLVRRIVIKMMAVLAGSATHLILLQAAEASG